MSDKSRQTKAGRKLSRAEVVDILERNAKLYKDDPTFTSYIVEMALYLLEYEYDWGNSGATPPEVIQAAQAAAQAAARPNTTPGEQGELPRKYQPIPPARSLKPQTRGGAGPAPAAKEPPPAIQRAARTPRPRSITNNPARNAAPQPAAQAPKLESIAMLGSGPAANPAPPPAPKTTAKTGEVRDLLRSISGLSVAQSARSCPHCGARIQDEHICPQCRNITR